MSSFENLRIVDNFYQTSLFFPMPTVIISTLCDDGSTNLGPYSLVQPYYVAGKDYYAMLLSCRNSSNTAQNILPDALLSDRFDKLTGDLDIDISFEQCDAYFAHCLCDIFLREPALTPQFFQNIMQSVA